MSASVFYIHNFGHAGDVILSRTIIKEIMAAYPEVRIVLICKRSNSYLWEDFDTEIVIIEDYEVIYERSFVSVNAEKAYVFNFHFLGKFDVFTPFGISYRCLVNIYNSYLKEFGIYEQYRLYDKRIMPFPEFPKSEPVIHVRNRAVLVENGAVLSGQCDFDFNEDLQELTAQFPMLNFYCSAKPEFTADNVFDCSEYNLIEISELSKSCIAFLTKASGVNAATLIEANKYKPRCFAGSSEFLKRWWQWELPENPAVYADDKEAIINFLSLINKNSEMLPIHISSMMANPEKYEIRLADYYENHTFCKFLKSREDIDFCTNYLNKCFLPAHIQGCKNWDIAHILSDLSDGNLLDMGSSDSYILLGALYKGIPGEKYGIDFREPTSPIPMVNYLVGDLMKDVNLPDGYFQNITCLSVLEHEVDFRVFAREVSRLLSVGGTLYVTFDYWEPKVRHNVKLYDLDWNILDKNDVLNLIAECKDNNLELTDEVDWELGDSVITYGYYSPAPGIDYTFGMLRFKKVV